MSISPVRSHRTRNEYESDAEPSDLKEKKYKKKKEKRGFSSKIKKKEISR